MEEKRFWVAPSLWQWCKDLSLLHSRSRTLWALQSRYQGCVFFLHFLVISRDLLQIGRNPLFALLLGLKSEKSQIKYFMIYKAQYTWYYKITPDYDTMVNLFIPNSPPKRSWTRGHVGFSYTQKLLGPRQTLTNLLNQWTLNPGWLSLIGSLPS